MSEETLKETQFEDQFRYCILQGGLNLKSARESYLLDLLGFDGAVPMLMNPQSRPTIKIENCGSLAEPVSSLAVDPGQISANESKPHDTTEANKSENPIAQTVKPITSSVLQGKRVIIRTNSMSGQKSIIFKQKTGGNVEIPAKLSSFLNTGTKIKQEVPVQVAEQVHPSNVAHVVFPQSDSVRHKPSILKRPAKMVFKSAKDFCDAVNNEVRNTHMDIKVEETGIFAEDVVEEAKILPFDHDYFNFPTSGVQFCPDDGPPPLVKISSGKVDNVIEIQDEDDRLSKNTSVVVNQTESRQIVPVKLVKSLVTHPESKNQFSEANFDRFHAQKLEETNEIRKMQEKERSEDKQVNLGKQTTLCKQENNKTIDSQLKKPPPPENKTIDIHTKIPPPTTNYEIVNTNLLKRNLTEKKNTYIVMIANKEMKEPTKGVKPSKVSKVKAIPPSFKIPFRQKLTDHKVVQTVDTRVFKNVETNTDDFLLDDLIEKKMRERALQNKVSKTTNTEELPPPRQNLDDRIAITPSPLLLGCDPSDILELLDGPNPHANPSIIGENADFGSGPIMGHVHPSFVGKTMNNVTTNGKVIDNCASVTDISYSRGKNVCNGWGAPDTVPNTNGWLASLAGISGRPRVEPWKLQLFLDLKNCDQFDSSGNMPLHNAVIQNNANLVKRQCIALRNRQIDINTLNHNTFTALQLALLHDASPHIVQLLLQHGADTSVLDPQGNNVLHICVTNSSESVTKLLINSTVCADINGANFEGYTPLIMCALYQKYVQADDLLSTGADPNIPDKKSGRTPLFHAVETNDVEMVKLLLNHRALTKVRNFFGTSPHDAMYELDTIDPQIRKLILNKDETPKSNPQEVKGRRKRKGDDDKTYSVRPYGAKNSRTKSPRS